MTTLPRGIVTFLFTDIEGSARLWERDRPAMAQAVARHDALLAGAIAAQRGVLFKHVGDMVQAAFHSAVDGVAAAVQAQRALAAEPWPETGPIRVRMGVHLGEAAPNARGDYNQIACLNRLSRLMSAGHGGQVLISAAVQQATAGRLPKGVTLRDLGRHRLRDLLEPERVSQLVIAGLPADFPPLKSLEGHPTNLPTLPTALLGRERELAEITTLLEAERPRMVTLVGPGGVGKTHVALQAAADLLDRFPDGVWLVRLGEVTDPAMIVPAIATTIGVREGGGLDMREALLHWIGTKRVLFVLDNVEQVVTGAPSIAALLAASPNLRILATSRQRLSIGGERVVPMQPLPLPTNERESDAGVEASPAVQLFLERARDVVPDFALDARTAPEIAAICRHLDGLPLAIELAAAQLRTHTLPELLADLERRFELLVGGRREALSHQRSLEATIAWSYERLDPETQRLVRLVSTFAGGWSKDAASRVASDVTDTGHKLDALVEQSLVRREALAADVSRWSMLESIRAFGRARLQEAGEDATAYERHASWCLAFSRDASTRLQGAEQEAWLDRLDLEHDNARAALRWWSDAGNAERGLALATALAPYWQTRGHLSEGRRWLEAMLRQAPADSEAGLSAMVEAGILAQTQGDLAGSGAWFTRALDAARRLGDRGREAALLNNLGGLALSQGDLDEAERFCLEALSLAELLGDQRRRADALANLGAAAHYRGDTHRALERYLECYQIWRGLNDRRGAADMLLNVLLLLAPLPAEQARARAAGEESLRSYRALGDPQGEALALSGLGLVAAVAGDRDQALALQKETLQLARRIEDRATEMRALGNLGAVEFDRGQLDEAEAYLRQSLQLASGIDDADGLAFGLELMAAVHAARGDDERAARIYGAAGALRQAIAIPIHPESRARHEEAGAALTRRLGDRFHALVKAGAALSHAQAMTEALARRPAPATSDPLAASLHALDDLLDLSLTPDVAEAP